MVQLTCPDASRWEALLADATSRDEATELEAHLVVVLALPDVLDDLAVGSSGWLRDAGRLAAATDHDPALTRTLHRLQDTPVDDDHAVPPIPLDFLTPSDQPGVLGTLGRYQVLAVLGRGAFGIVLKALDPDLLRPVAIKVLAPYLAPSGTARQRFLREARAAAAVSHDHVVTIHAVEPADAAVPRHGVRHRRFAPGPARSRRPAPAEGHRPHRPASRQRPGGGPRRRAWSTATSSRRTSCSKTASSASSSPTSAWPAPPTMPG